MVAILMSIPMIMTPGPTSVRENVRLARAMETTNPDLDLEFYDFYKETCDKIGEFLKTKNSVRILSGEGILGLEAACASLTEAGDRVLVLDNGVFGEGFGDFVKMYGGEPVYFKGDRKEAINLDELTSFLQKDSSFKYATIVHCDTPSGILNPVQDICPLLKEKGILTVVDSVSAMGGEELKVDSWGIDVALGASQKCLSAPTGLSFLSISDEAFKAMENRKTPIGSFYCNLLAWKDYYEKKWFPYTPPISDIVGLRRAVDNILEDKEILERHEGIANALRNAVTKAGLNLYTRNGYSNTVTVIEVPEGINSKQLTDYILKEFNLMIAGSFDFLQGKVIRIGNMGENSTKEKIIYTLNALQSTFEYYKVNLKANMANEFIQALKINY